MREVARPPEVWRLEELRADLNKQLVVVMRKWFDFRFVTFPAHHCRDSECRVLHSELFQNGPEMLFEAGTGISYVRVEQYFCAVPSARPEAARSDARVDRSDLPADCHLLGEHRSKLFRKSRALGDRALRDLALRGSSTQARK